MIMAAVRLALAFVVFLPFTLILQAVWLGYSLAAWPLLTIGFFVARDHGFQKFFWGEFIVAPMMMFKELVVSAGAYET